MALYALSIVENIFLSVRSFLWLLSCILYGFTLFLSIYISGYSIHLPMYSSVLPSLEVLKPPNNIFPYPFPNNPLGNTSIKLKTRE